MNQDFVGFSQMAYFAPNGLDTTSVSFIVRNDDEPEIEETYFFNLTVHGTDTNAVVDIPNIATVIIEANDDAYGLFSFIDVRVMGT